VERAITETTRMTLGVPVNPHRFRTSVATSAALHASHSPHLASALLQHSDSKVTEEHYNRASSLSVARDFAKLVRELSDT
jgi:integrase